MKTPMQEHIEWLKKEHELIQRLGGENERLIIVDCIKNAESMLEKEKEVMESAWQDGMYECDGDGTFEDFYKTFKTNEK